MQVRYQRADDALKRAEARTSVAARALEREGRKLARARARMTSAAQDLAEANIAPRQRTFVLAADGRYAYPQPGLAFGSLRGLSWE